MGMTAIECFLARLQVINLRMKQIADRIDIIEEQQINHENRLMDIETKDDMDYEQKP